MIVTQPRVIRLLSKITPDDYVDRTVVVSSRGEGKKPFIIKEMIHDRYHLIKRLSPEALDAGARPPKHDQIFIDPSDFMYHFLRKVRRT